MSFLQGEGPSRGLLCDWESLIFVNVRFQLCSGHLAVLGARWYIYSPFIWIVVSRLDKSPSSWSRVCETIQSLVNYDANTRCPDLTRDIHHIVQSTGVSATRISLALDAALMVYGLWTHEILIGSTLLCEQWSIYSFFLSFSVKLCLKWKAPLLCWCRDTPSWMLVVIGRDKAAFDKWRHHLLLFWHLYPAIAAIYQHCRGISYIWHQQNTDTHKKMPSF